MSARPARRTSRTPAVEQLIAPHVDPRWAETLLIELRLRGVDGPRIGAVLAEVESHCAESGEGAADAFGDPAVYARSLDLPRPEATTAGGLARAALPTVVQLAGMYLLLWSAADTLAGRAVDVTAGQGVSFGVLLVAVAALARWVDPLVRGLTATPLLSWSVLRVCVVLWLVTAAIVVPNVVLDDVVLRAPGLALVVAGALTLAAGTVAALRSRDLDAATAVVPPLPGDPVAEVPAPRGPGQAVTDVLTRHLAVAVAWLVPVGTVALLALELALDR